MFGWFKVFADVFIYNFYSAIVIVGNFLFFINFKYYKKKYKSIIPITIFMVVSIISIFVYYYLYHLPSIYRPSQGRYFFSGYLCFYFCYPGFPSIKNKFGFNNIFYYFVFSYTLLINIFCIYNYVFLESLNHVYFPE